MSEYRPKDLAAEADRERCDRLIEQLKDDAREAGKVFEGGPYGFEILEIGE